MTIYWFKGLGLFTGHGRDIGCTEAEMMDNCDAAIKVGAERKLTKNRHGGLRELTPKEVSNLYILTLDGQYNFFAGIPHVHQK